MGPQSAVLLTVVKALYVIDNLTWVSLSVIPNEYSTSDFYNLPIESANARTDSNNIVTNINSATTATNENHNIIKIPPDNYTDYLKTDDFFQNIPYSSIESSLFNRYDTDNYNNNNNNFSHNNIEDVILDENKPAIIRCTIRGGHPEVKTVIFLDDLNLTRYFNVSSRVKLVGISGFKRFDMETVLATNKFFTFSYKFHGRILRCLAASGGRHQHMWAGVRLRVNHKPIVNCVNETAELYQRDVWLRCQIISNSANTTPSIVWGEGTQIKDFGVFDASLRIKIATPNSFRVYSVTAVNNLGTTVGNVCLMQSKVTKTGADIQSQQKQISQTRSWNGFKLNIFSNTDDDDDPFLSSLKQLVKRLEIQFVKRRKLYTGTVVERNIFPTVYASNNVLGVNSSRDEFQQLGNKSGSAAVELLENENNPKMTESDKKLGAADILNIAEGIVNSGNLNKKRFLVFAFSSAFGGRVASEKFIAKHQHKTFATRFSAVRTHNDATLFGALRFGMHLGVKAGIFACLYMLSSQAISAYRNKSTLWEYVGAGGLTCSFLRAGHGWRGMVVGGFFGLGFGLFGGACVLGLFKFMNYTQEERHYRFVLDKCKEIRPWRIRGGKREGHLARAFEFETDIH
ncbi:hypothetical protein HELRODRAFT_194638 [Helobdella robusta]|uniref:Complex I assembly factor TIMMDC1, mitochondrial n=1 Tax=Helobdella robusta TaxID=6412 RepID=T1FW95_HELRO|nr:hypothetical protein HELRODRAFT_194638 [Helobdella robusta]ESN90853.1 hypothetical protein HELRODRAFT_194638 [Helobdella robusta]